MKAPCAPYGQVQQGPSGCLAGHGGFHGHGGSQNGWFISWENPINMDDLGLI